MSDIWCQMFHVIYLMSGVCCLMSDVWCLVSRVWYNFMMSDIWCLMSDVWCLMPDIWGQTFDVWCIISDYMLAINSSHGHAFVFLSLHLPHIINPLLNKKSSIKPPLSYKPPTPPPQPFQGKKVNKPPLYFKLPFPLNLLFFTNKR